MSKFENKKMNYGNLMQKSLLLKIKPDSMDLKKEKVITITFKLKEKPYFFTFENRYYLESLN
jgi:hypothetical protein